MTILIFTLGFLFFLWCALMLAGVLTILVELRRVNKVLCNQKTDGV